MQRKGPTGKVTTITTIVAMRWVCYLILAVAHFQCTNTVEDWAQSKTDLRANTAGLLGAGGAKAVCQSKEATTCTLCNVVSHRSMSVKHPLLCRSSILCFSSSSSMWKSGIDGETDEIDSRVPIPGPAKSLIREYCGFAGLLEPTIEGS